MDPSGAQIEVGERGLGRRATDDPQLVGREAEVLRCPVQPGAHDDAVAGENAPDPRLVVDPMRAREQELGRFELDLEPGGRRRALLEVEQPLPPEEEILHRLLDRLRQARAQARLVEQPEVAEGLAERQAPQPAMGQSLGEILGAEDAVRHEVLAVMLRRLVRPAIEDLAGAKSDAFFALGPAHHERAGDTLRQRPLQEVRGWEDGKPAGELHGSILARAFHRRRTRETAGRAPGVSAWGPRSARPRRPTPRSD